VTVSNPEPRPKLGLGLGVGIKVYNPSQRKMGHVKWNRAGRDEGGEGEITLEKMSKVMGQGIVEGRERWNCQLRWGLLRRLLGGIANLTQGREAGT